MIGNDNRIMVTINCLAYNHAPYIRQCLEGFVMQKTNFRFEAIVHDDASTDETAAIIKEYADKYPDIIKPIFETENLYSKHNGSLKRVMYEHTYGKYVAMCEGDDYWIDPLKLQKQVDFLEKHPECSMCFHRSREIMEGVDIPLVFSHLHTGYYSGKDILETWSVPTASVVYRNYGAYLQKRCKGVIHGDIYLFLLLAERGKLYCLPDEMSVYRRNPKSITLNEKNAQSLERYIIHYRALMNFFPRKYDKILQRKINLTYCKLFKMSLFSSKTLYYLFHCLEHPIFCMKNICIYINK